MLRGTGPESVTKYQDSVYCAKADASALCVDPPQPLRTHPGRRARGATLAQTTRFPPGAGQHARPRGGPAPFTLLLRVPSWATAGFRVTVNGRAVPGTPVPGGCFGVSRTWRAGDAVRVPVPFRPRVERALDDPALQTLFLGPVDLAARRPSAGLLRCAPCGNAGLSGDLLPPRSTRSPGSRCTTR